jgi:hypothetical protein
MEVFIADMIVDMVKGNGKKISDARDIIECLTTDHIEELKDLLWKYIIEELDYTSMLKEIWTIKEESESESE